MGTRDTGALPIRPQGNIGPPEGNSNNNNNKKVKKDRSVSQSVSIIPVHIKQLIMYTYGIVLTSAGSYKGCKKKKNHYSFPLKKNLFALMVETEQTCKNKPNTKLPKSIQRYISTSQRV